MILHISNDYNLTKVHKQLYYNLDRLKIEQLIFIPLRTEDQIGKNHFKFSCNNSKYIYSKKINLFHRIIFPLKILTLYNSLISQVDINKVELVHATTLFSDGAVAYKIYKKYKIPYIVAVRNSDINFYFKKRKELMRLGIKIIRNAEKIIFISESNKKAFLNFSLLRKKLPMILPKLLTFYNGIDDFWIENRKPYQFNNKDDKCTFLFIGRFDSNKNVEKLVKGLIEFKNKTNLPIQLKIVGGRGDNQTKVLRVIKSHEWIKYYGEVYDLQKLKNIIRSSDYFCMISHTETFGLVFLEALSQGKPILYTKNQGIDGLFNFKVGEGVDSRSLVCITQGLETLTSANYDSINDIEYERFSWYEIAKKYKNLYKQIINK